MFAISPPLFGRDTYISVFTAHRVTGYSCRMLTHLIETGELPAIRKGRPWRIKESDLVLCILRRICLAKVRNSAVISKLTLDRPRFKGLTSECYSTIYSTGLRVRKKEKTHAHHQEPNEVQK